MSNKLNTVKDYLATQQQNSARVRHKNSINTENLVDKIIDALYKKIEGTNVNEIKIPGKYIKRAEAAVNNPKFIDFVKREKSIKDDAGWKKELAEVVENLIGGIGGYIYAKTQFKLHEKKQHDALRILQFFSYTLAEDVKSKQHKFDRSVDTERIIRGIVRGLVTERLIALENVSFGSKNEDNLIDFFCRNILALVKHAKDSLPINKDVCEKVAYVLDNIGDHLSKKAKKARLELTGEAKENGREKMIYTTQGLLFFGKPKYPGNPNYSEEEYLEHLNNEPKLGARRGG